MLLVVVEKEQEKVKLKVILHYQEIVTMKEVKLQMLLMRLLASPLLQLSSSPHSHPLLQVIK